MGKQLSRLSYEAHVQLFSFNEIRNVVIALNEARIFLSIPQRERAGL